MTATSDLSLPLQQLQHIQRSKDMSAVVLPKVGCLLQYASYVIQNKTPTGPRSLLGQSLDHTIHHLLLAGQLQA